MASAFEVELPLWDVTYPPPYIHGKQPLLLPHELPGTLYSAYREEFNKWTCFLSLLGGTFWQLFGPM